MAMIIALDEIENLESGENEQKCCRFFNSQITRTFVYTTVQVTWSVVLFIYAHHQHARID